MSQAGMPESPVERHFEGDVRLFEAFRAASWLQFEHDLVRGDAALLAGNTEELRRIGHDLKTVLPLLGDDAGAAHARELEAAVKAAVLGDDTVRRAWQALRPSLIARG